MKNKYYTYYLIFVLIACTGAIIWQLFFPYMAQTNSSWGLSSAWQREIVLWNIALVCAIIYALIKKESQSLKILSFQSTLLFIILGTNHTVAFFYNIPKFYFIHFLGMTEILLLGGLWGIFTLVKENDRNNKNR